MIFTLGSNSTGLLPAARAAARHYAELPYNREKRVSQKEALRRGMQLREFRQLDRRFDGLAGFPPEFLPVLIHDLRANGLLGDLTHAAILARIAGLVGAYREAGELLGRIDRDADGFVSEEEALRVGLRKKDFLEFDRDGDGKVDYLREFVPRAVNRLLEDQILREDEHARIAAALVRMRRWKDGSSLAAR